MDAPGRWGRLQERVQRYRILFGLVSLGLFLLGVGVISSLVLAQRDWQGVELIEQSPSAPPAGEEPSGIVVDIAGAVERPGVYRLAAGARIWDALAQAGGLSALADRNWVARELNLALKVSDGMKVYIPEEGGPVNILGTRDDRQTSPGEQPLRDSKIGFSRISVNTATVVELDTLWGVGKTRAEAIIRGRPYSRLEELVERKIIPKNVYERNSTQLSL